MGFEAVATDSICNYNQMETAVVLRSLPLWLSLISKLKLNSKSSLPLSQTVASLACCQRVSLFETVRKLPKHLKRM